MAARAWEGGRERKESTKSIKPLFVSLKVFLIYNVLECSCHPAVQPSPCCLSLFFSPPASLPHLTGTAINFFPSEAVTVNGFICGQWLPRDKGDNIIKVFNSMPEQLSPELMIISWLQ